MWNLWLNICFTLEATISNWNWIMVLIWVNIPNHFGFIIFPQQGKSQSHQWLSSHLAHLNLPTALSSVKGTSETQVQSPIAGRKMEGNGGSLDRTGLSPTMKNGRRLKKSSVKWRTQSAWSRVIPGTTPFIWKVCLCFLLSVTASQYNTFTVL